MINSEIEFHNKNIYSEYLIIGSGPGGSVAAKKLIDNKKEVLLVEEGNNFNIDSFNGSISKSILYSYRNGGVTPIIGKPNFGFAEGKCLGGGSFVNGGLVWRTPEIVLENWSQKLNSNLYSNYNLLKYFKKTEENLKVKIENEEEEKDNDSKILKKIAERNNLKCTKVFRATSNCKKSNCCTTGCPTKAKNSTLAKYLYESIPNGLKIITNSRVDKIFLKNGEANYVEIKKNNKIIKIFFKKIILACGATQTPLLIKKSFGTKSLISQMQIHLNLRINVVFDDIINSEKGTIFTRKINHFLPDGVLMSAANYNKAYLFSGFSKFTNEDILKFEKNYYNKTATYTMQVASKNVVDLNNIKDLIILKYRMCEDDFIKIKNYLNFFSKLFFDYGALKIILPFKKNFELKKSDNFKLFFENKKISELEMISVHGMSSARMGINSKFFFNIHGQSYNYPNIYCVDSSILPGDTIESPQGTIMAFAESIVEQMLCG